jgi:hypothetical protein
MTPEKAKEFEKKIAAKKRRESSVERQTGLR